MAIGKLQIEIKGQDFIQGMATSSEIIDAGYSPETFNVSLTNIPGCIASSFATSGNTLASEIICTCDAGANGSVAKFALGIGAGAGSHVYYQDPTTFLLSSYGTYTGTTGNLYSDMVSYLGDIYFTTQTDICHIANSGTTSGSIDSTWWTVTKSQSSPLTTGKKHHLFVFNGLMFITDGQFIHSFDGSTIIPARLTLNSDQEILDIGGDLAQGRMLVSFAQNVGSSFLQTNTYQYFVGSWDTSDPSKFVYPAVQVEDIVWTFIYFGGYQYVIYGNNFGYFTGSGIQFLRKLNFDQTIAFQVINKHKVCVSPSFLYIADLTQILAYGNITKDNKIFWYLYTASLGNIICLYKATPTKLGIGYDDSNKDTGYFDLTLNNQSQSNSKFYSLQYYFPKPVYIRDIDIDYQVAIPGGGVATGVAGIIKILNEQNQLISVNPTNFNDSTAKYSIIHTVSNPPKLRRMQLQYIFVNGYYPVKRFVIRYDIAE